MQCGEFSEKREQERNDDSIKSVNTFDSCLHYEDDSVNTRTAHFPLNIAPNLGNNSSNLEQQELRFFHPFGIKIFL